MEIKKELESLIQKTLKKLDISVSEVVLEYPADISHGDFATNVALIAAKQAKKNPREFAEQIRASLLSGKPDFVEKIEVAGPGFINFFLSREFFTGEVVRIVREKKNYGRSDIGKGKKILIEYSSPNIAKPFTVGHLRSTIIGDAIANLYEFSGYKVIRDNHLGDWGTQFGKQIVAIKKWGSIAELENKETIVQKMKYLVDLYVKFHEEAEKDPKLEDEGRATFAKLEKGDRNILSLYKKIVVVSKKYFENIYAKLHVNNFDTENGEYFYEPYIPKVLNTLNKAKLLKKSEGAELVFFENEKFPPLMIKKSDGATLYATRDLAADLCRLKKYGKDVTIINEVGGEQSLYFKQLFETEKMLGWFGEGKRVHVAHGLYRFKDGKMSTRKGNAIWLEDIIDEAVKRAKEINPESAEKVAIAGIKFNDLRREAAQDIVFDWDEMLNIKGDSGPYLQYAAVRANSVLEKAKKEGLKISAKTPDENISVLERKIARFPDVAARASFERAPHQIATYLLDLAAEFNSYYATTKIIDAGNPYTSYRLSLTNAFEIIMKNGLKLLGIEVPEKM